MASSGLVSLFETVYGPNRDFDLSFYTHLCYITVTSSFKAHEEVKQTYNRSSKFLFSHKIIENLISFNLFLLMLDHQANEEMIFYLQFRMLHLYYLCLIWKEEKNIPRPIRSYKVLSRFLMCKQPYQWKVQRPFETHHRQCAIGSHKVVLFQHLFISITIA